MNEWIISLENLKYTITNKADPHIYVFIGL